MSVLSVLPSGSSQIGIRGRLDPGHPPDPCPLRIAEILSLSVKTIRPLKPCLYDVMQKFCLFLSNPVGSSRPLPIAYCRNFVFFCQTLSGPPDPCLPGNRIVKNRYHVKRFLDYFLEVRTPWSNHVGLVVVAGFVPI